ncbi:MAG: M14 family metallopeptidase, partial [Deltaproteobacteria bacterium]|nr:M14 family metallopeptidase [Deltaproteobacteria bacterium]
EVDQDWTTHAEREGYRSTPSYDETLGYLRRLADASPALELQTFGRTGLGREMVVAVVSSDGAFDPARARATGKPIVLVQNGIHPGEIAGKDASLMLLRDLLVHGKRAEVYENTVLLVVPVYNIDGHEKLGQSRINQDGPAEGMGFRTNAAGLDLNRDYMKLDAPESRAMVGELIAGWDPHLFVDLHTTDGIDHRYHVAYGVDLGPRAAPSVRDWTASLLEGVSARMEDAGRPTAPYIFPKDWPDPSNGFVGGWTNPRFSTSYVTLRGRSALLLEAHALKPYETRVKALYDHLGFILDAVAADPEALVSAVREADERARVAARRRGPEDRVVVQVERSEESRPFSLRTYESEVVPGTVGGRPYVIWTDEPLDVEVTLFDDMQLLQDLPHPAGYLVPPQYPLLVERLQAHGLKLVALPAEVSVQVEMLRMTDVAFEGEPYQGRQQVTVKQWDVERGERTFPAGSWWLSLDQPAALVAVQLLEPTAPDSFLAWGFLSRVLERKEYFEVYAMEPLGERMLAEDPVLRKAFEEAVRTDPELAGDARSRLEFVYRHSPHADPDYRLYPIARVPSDAPLAPLQPK